MADPTRRPTGAFWRGATDRLVDLSPRRRLAATAAPAVLIAALGGLSLWGFEHRDASRDSVERTLRVELALERAFSRVKDAETAQRGFLLTGETRYLAPGAGARAEVAQDVGGLRELVRDPAVRARLDTLEGLIERRFTIIERNVARRQAAPLAPATADSLAAEGKAAMDALRAAMDRMMARQRTVLAARTAADERLERRVVLTAVVGTVIALLLALLVNRLLARYAERQAETAQALDAQNRQLQEQQIELELQTERLHEQQIELEAANEELLSTNEELLSTNEELALQRSAAESARHGTALILASVDEGILGTDAEGRTTFVNPAAERMLGWTAAELVGRVQHDVIHHHHPDGTVYPRHACGLARALETGESAHSDGEVFWRKDGTPLLVEYHMVPSIQDGRVIGTVVTFRDITAWRAEQAALETSEERFRTLSSSSPVGIFESDDAGCVTYANPRLAEICGLEAPESLLGDGWIAHTHPDDREALVAGWTAAIRDQCEYERSYRLLLPDGAVRWVHGRSAPRRDGTGRVVGAVGTVEDITAQREAELAFRTLAESMPQIVWSTKADGYHDYFNGHWYLYTGMPRPGTPGGEGEVPQGWHWKDYLHPDDYDRTVAVWQHSLDTGEPYEIEYRFKEAATGEYRWFLARALPQRDEEGRIVRWFGTCTDIDDAKRAEAEREQLLRSERSSRTEAEAARAEAEEANRAKAQFLTTMSHELRTPLNAIGGYAELMALGIRGPVTAEQLEDLGRIRRSGQHLLSLINDILNFARLEAGTVDLRTGRVELREVLVAVEAMVAPQFTARGLRYEVGGAAGCADCVAWADAEKVRQILLNLMTNAGKFTDAGGTIEVTCGFTSLAGFADGRATGATTGEQVVVRVRDTGRGIPPEQLERIFEPFVQIDRHLTHASQQGVGLGLAISRELARLMGGDLTAESAVGVGSVFTLTLPVGSRSEDRAGVRAGMVPGLGIPREPRAGTKPAG